MNEICYFCAHQKISDRIDGVECDIACFDINNYGRFKRGSGCIYDGDLKSHFIPKDDIKSIISQFKKDLDNINLANMKLRDEVKILKDRLVKIK